MGKEKHHSVMWELRSEKMSDWRQGSREQYSSWKDFERGMRLPGAARRGRVERCVEAAWGWSAAWQRVAQQQFAPHAVVARAVERADGRLSYGGGCGIEYHRASRRSQRIEELAAHARGIKERCDAALARQRRRH